MGLRLVMRMPAEAVVVHVAVYRAGLGGARAGDPVAAADRLALGANGVLRMRLHARPFRRLRPGRYIVDVRLGRGAGRPRPRRDDAADRHALSPHDWPRAGGGPARGRARARARRDR